MAPDPGRRAIVIGRWGNDTALLRAADGSTFEVPVPEHFRNRIEVGMRVVLLPGGRVDWDDARNEDSTR